MTLARVKPPKRVCRVAELLSGVKDLESLNEVLKVIDVSPKFVVTPYKVVGVEYGWEVWGPRKCLFRISIKDGKVRIYQNCGRSTTYLHPLLWLKINEFSLR